MKFILSILFFIMACSSTKTTENSPKCYFFLGTGVVKIKTEGSQAYLYSQFNKQDTFYWEDLSYIENYYLPDKCTPDLLNRAKALLNEKSSSSK